MEKHVESSSVTFLPNTSWEPHCWLDLISGVLGSQWPQGWRSDTTTLQASATGWYLLGLQFKWTIWNTHSCQTLQHESGKTVQAWGSRVSCPFLLMIRSHWSHCNFWKGKVRLLLVAYLGEISMLGTHRVQFLFECWPKLHVCDKKGISVRLRGGLRW